MTTNDPLDPTARARCATARNAMMREARLRLDDQTQADLLTSWRYGKELSATPGARRSRTARRLIREGESDVAALMASLDGLAIAIANETSTQRMGRKAPTHLMDDYLGEARLVMFEALDSYNPSRGSTVSRWVAARVRQHLRGLDIATGGGDRPVSWRRVGRVARRLLADQPGLSMAQLQDLVRDEFEQTKRDSYLSRDPSLDESTLEWRVHDRLSRESIYAAIDDLQRVLEVHDGAVSIDAQRGNDPDAPTLADGLAGVTDGPSHAKVMLSILEGLPEQHFTLLLKRFESERPSVTSLATQMGMEPAAARRIIRRGQARVAAPHAQFARLSIDAGTQTEWAPNDSPTPADRIAGRRLVA